MLLFVTAVTILIVPALGDVGDNCHVSTDDKSGICILLEQCGLLMDEVNAAGNPMPIHMNRKLQRFGCGYIGTDPLVCCPILTFPLRYALDSPNLNLLPSDCGLVYGTPRIMGGDPPKLFEMPWMVLLLYNVEGTKKFGCGGTLINNKYVLTAAHCVVPKEGTELIGVTLGEHDVMTDPDCEVDDSSGHKRCAPSVVNATIEETIPHSLYRRETLLYDIALIRLSEPVNFNTGSIRPICLPITEELQMEKLDGKHVNVAGWGLTEKSIQSPVLLQIALPIIKNEECQQNCTGITDDQLCAGGVAGKNSCTGDSGGPLTYPGRLDSTLRTVQRGIISYGPAGCGKLGEPLVSTRVSHYMEWILDTIRG